jgi:hypothetical protein
MSSFNNAISSTNNNRKVLEFADWNPKSHKYMAPKVNDKGGKSVTLISTQTSRSLHLNTPLLMTWGPNDFANDDGTSDGKFKLPFNFPNEDYKTDATETFKQKMLDFQSNIIDDAVVNAELWFGKKKSRELVEDSFFPFMKYPKVKDANGKATQTIDYSKPPSFSVKMPCYPQDDGTSKWDVDLFDTNYNLIFPNEEGTTPVDLIPKLSKIAATIQCTGIWVGGKGWGLTWKFISGVVKPKITETIRGKCHIRLIDTDLDVMNQQDTPVEEPSLARTPSVVAEPISTTVEDSDEEDDSVAVAHIPDDVVTPPVTPQVTAEPPKIIKKVVKKKVVA